MASRNDTSKYDLAAAHLQFAIRSMLFAAVAVIGLAVATATGAWWNTALAFAGVALALAGMMLSIAQLLDREPRPDGSRGSWRAIGVGGAAAMMLVLAATLPEHLAARSGPEAGAQDTVRGFLTAAVLESDGYLACQYLTPAEQSRVARLAGEGETCLQAFVASRPAFPGVASEGELKELDLRTVVRGGRATVVVPRSRRKPVTFVLRRATRAQLAGFRAPQVPWRIQSGAAAAL